MLSRFRPIQHAPRWHLEVVILLYLLIAVAFAFSGLAISRYLSSRAEQRREAEAGVGRLANAAAESAALLAESEDGITATGLGLNIDWIALSEFGTGFIVSREGTVVASTAWGVSNQTVDDLPDGYSVLARSALSASEYRPQDMLDPGLTVPGGPVTAAYSVLGAQNWVLLFVARDEDIYARSDTTRKALIGLVPPLISVVILVTLLTSRAYAGSLEGLWSLAFVASASFIVGIALIWFWEASTPRLPRIAEHGVGESVHAYKEVLRSDYDRTSIDMVTGMFLTYGQLTGLGKQFSSAAEAFVKGFLWQTIGDRRKFSADTGGAETLETLSTGVLIPEASSSEFEQEYRYLTLQGDSPVETTGWSFDASVKYAFDAGRFPIDHGSIQVPMWPEDFEREVLLLPDLQSYASAIATRRPGLADSFQVSGWRIEGSYFSYRTVNNNTTFGLARTTQGAGSAVLVFNVSMRRVFVHTFVSGVLPLAIIAFLLFIALTINTKMTRSRFGFGGGSETMGGATGSPTYGLISLSIVMSYTGALLFALILAHSRLRGEVPASGLLYLEYFYFVMYFAVVAVSVNAILYASHLGGGIIHFRDNLIPRVLYWPLITGMLFGITWSIFN